MIRKQRNANLTLDAAILTDQSHFIFAPFRILSSFISENRFNFPDANLYVFFCAICLLYLVYVFKFLSCLKRQFFQLNSTSIFKEIFSGWQMAGRDELASKMRLKKTYFNMKKKMANGFAKWSTVGISFALFINVVIICIIVAVTYVSFVFGSLNRDILHLVSGSNALYYTFFCVAYLICKHVIPWIFFAIRNIGFHNPEVKVNFYSGRCFASLATFYIILITSLILEFEHGWQDILQQHIYLHTCLDIVLLPTNLLFVCLPSRISSRIGLFIPRLHPFDEFVCHEFVGRFATELLIFLLAMSLSHTLALICLAKLLLTYLVIYAAANLVGVIRHNLYFAKNVEFLEICFTVVQMTFLFIVELFILLPNLRHCPSMTILKDYIALPNHPREIFANVFNVSTFSLFLVILLLSLFLLRSSVDKFRLKLESRFLKKHLEDINQDKNYQVMKQKQWYPMCKCHESRTKRNTNRQNRQGSKQRVS